MSFVKNGPFGLIFIPDTNYNMVIIYLFHSLLVPREAEGTYKFMPVRASVRSSVSNALFSELARYFFLIFLHEVRGLYMLKSDRARFSWKNPISPFLGKKGSNWAQNEF